MTFHELHSVPFNFSIVDCKTQTEMLLKGLVTQVNFSIIASKQGENLGALMIGAKARAYFQPLTKLQRS